MPNVNDLKRSRFLQQHEVDPPVVVTITRYEEVNVAMEQSEPDMRWVLYFRELEKSLPLNSTNGQIIQQILGSGEFTDWINKQIVLYRDPTISFGGKLVGGIRVRPLRQRVQEEAPPPTDADVPEEKSFEEEYDIQ